MHRRRLLGAGTHAALAGLAGPLSGPRATMARAPFTLGVASGSPTASSVVLWTRLAPEPQAAGGGMDEGPVTVDWILAADEGMSRVVRRGSAVADAPSAHSVHVPVDGLPADRHYWYRFSAGGFSAPVGRTRTLPDDGAQAVRFVTVCCQNYAHGHFAAYRAIVAAEPAFVLHLGDYIYDVAFGAAVRRHETEARPDTLDALRRRHATYKTDPDLMEAHRLLPFIVVPDNHDLDEDGSSATAARRRAAEQAWLEHMPVRQPPRSGQARFDGTLAVGSLMTLHLLDTRRSRDPQDVDASADDTGFGVYRTPGATVAGRERTMLGADQEARLARALEGDAATWSAVVSTVPVVPMPIREGGRVLAYAGGWDWYPAARARLLASVGKARINNLMVLSGDIHSSWALDLVDPERGDQTIGAEIVTSSLTSDWPEVLARPMRDGAGSNPCVRFSDTGRRGFVLHDVGPLAWRALCMASVDITAPDPRVYSFARMVVEAGRPGFAEVETLVSSAAEPSPGGLLIG